MLQQVLQRTPFKINETRGNLRIFPTTLSILFLPDIGFHRENPLYSTVLHNKEQMKRTLRCISNRQQIKLEYVIICNALYTPL